MDKVAHRNLMEESYFKNVRFPNAIETTATRILGSLQVFFLHNPLRKMDGEDPSQSWTRVKQVVELALKLKADLIFNNSRFHLHNFAPGTPFDESKMADVSHKDSGLTHKTVRLCLAPAFFMVPDTHSAAAGGMEEPRALSKNFISGNVDTTEFTLISKAQVLLND